jgi:hypothetical protein
MQFQLLRSLRLFIAVATGVACLLVLAAPPTFAGQPKTFTGMKICRAPFVTVAPPNPGGYCLFTQASIKSLVGAKAYYTDAHIVLGVLNSPVTIRVDDERGSTIAGHCTYYYPPAINPWHGLCVYSGGTGRFSGFDATWVIGSPTPAGVTVIGPYWFDRDHPNDADHGGD